MDGADWLTLTGGIFQAVGLGLTVWEIIRTEDRTFPERKHRMRRALVRVRQWLPGRRHTHPVGRTVEMSADVSGKATLTGELSIVPDSDDIKGRLEWLEQRIERQDRTHREAVAQLRTETSAEDLLLGTRIANLANDVNAARDEDRRALDESLARQKLYTGLFVFGTALATAGGLLA